jgi:hypothetical protein
MKIVFAAALGLAVLAGSSAASQAAEGCGPDRYYNGYRCVPYEREYYPRRPYREYYEEPRPGLEFRFGGHDDDRRYSPPSPRWRTWNGCPQGYTVQDGVCKPYTGR